uniref:Uncharacterized protein n=1 Tax=Arundo donax TaxID=35708 RepID=A0A0A8YXS5_ARUDO
MWMEEAVTAHPLARDDSLVKIR